MKITEIILEYDSAESQLSGGNLSANLLPVLMFLKNRSADKGLTPKLRTDSLIQLVQNAGDTAFSYDSLVSANETDPAVKNLIKSLSKEETILNASLADTPDDEGAEDGDIAGAIQNGQGGQPGQNPNNPFVQSPEQVVNGMAKKALNKRS